jgi:nitrogen regulatory protein PII
MDYKIITAIMREDLTVEILDALADMGIITADRSKGRGTKKQNVNGEEMEVVTVLVTNDRADEVFNYIFETAHLNQPHNGMIYQQKVSKASDYKLT